MRLAALCLLLGATACLRVAEERAERDQQVGRAVVEQVAVTVEDGLATVRHAGPGELTLWSGAPGFELTFDVPAGARGDWVLQVHNCLPGARLEATDATGVLVEPLDETIRTRKRWRVQLPVGTTALRLGAPDGQRLEPFRFALLSDVQDAIDRLYEIHDRINEDPSIRFLLGTGDLTEQGRADQLARYKGELLGLDIPYYTTLGNHELGSTPTEWHDAFGRGSFSFELHGVRFTLLDSASATLDPMVYDWLDDWLEAGRDQVHVVAMHVPPIDPVGLRNGSFASRNEAAKLLVRLARADVDLTLYGHLHSYYEFENAGIPARVSGGGGAIQERLDGIGRHFVTIDVDPDQGTVTTAAVRVD